MRLTDLRKEIQNTRVELVTLKNGIKAEINNMPRDSKYSEKYYKEQESKLYEPYYKAVADAKAKYSGMLMDAERVASDNIKVFYSTPPTNEQRELISVMRERAERIERNNFRTYIPREEMRLFYDAIKDNYLAQTLAKDIFDKNMITADDVLIMPTDLAGVSSTLTKITRLMSDAINALDAEPKNMTYGVADFYISKDDIGINSVYMGIVDDLSKEDHSTKGEPATAEPDQAEGIKQMTFGELVNEAIVDAQANAEVFKVGKLKVFREQHADALLKDTNECKALLDKLATISNSGY